MRANDTKICLPKKKERIYYYDNLKAIAIFLVVLGHMLELFPCHGVEYIYLLIYAVHMPLFAFVSGVFSKFDPKKIFLELIVPYVLFQILFWLLKWFLGDKIQLQFTTPYWILWYIFALCVWKCFVPFLLMVPKSYRGGIVIILFLTSVFSGYDYSLGLYLSLMRIIYFLPFFVLGFYLKNSEITVIKKLFLRDEIQRNTLKAFLVFLSFLLLFFVIKQGDTLIPVDYFKAFINYSRVGYTAIDRVKTYFVTICLSSLVLMFTPNKQIFFTKIGCYTMSIYIGHGLIYQIISHYNLLTQEYNILVSVLTSIVIVLLIWMLNEVFLYLRNRLKGVHENEGD